MKGVTQREGVKRVTGVTVRQALGWRGEQGVAKNVWDFSPLLLINWWRVKGVTL